MTKGIDRERKGRVARKGKRQLKGRVERGTKGDKKGGKKSMLFLLFK